MSTALDRRQVDLDRGDAQAEPRGLPREPGDLGAPEHHLGRDAAVVAAFAAELVALGDRDAEVRSLRELEGDLGTGTAAADHEDVEPLHHEPSRNRVNTRA